MNAFKKRGLCVVRAVFQAAPDLTAKIAPWLGSRMPKRMLRVASDCSAALGDSAAVVGRIAASWAQLIWGVGGDISLQSLPNAPRVFPWALFIAQQKPKQFGVTDGDGGLLSILSPSGTGTKSQHFL